MNEGLNKKLAEWRFPEYIRIEFAKDGSINGVMPEGNYHWISKPFTQSLDAIFKWLVPKVAFGNEIRIIIPPNTTQRFLVEIGHQDRVEERTLSLALCLTIEKLIDSKSE